MAQICDGCGEQAARWSYAADGPWAGKHICRECRHKGRRLKRLSWMVTFKFKVAQVLPPDDLLTVPMMRLLMAVDDVRRAQVALIEASERLDHAPSVEKYRFMGDFLYSIRLLFSHLHEAGTALKTLDIKAKNRVDTMLQDNAEAVESLRAARRFFNAQDYNQSLVARVRNVIGFHYQDQDVGALVAAEFTPDSLLESTAAEVGGLARVADPFVHAIMNNLAGGNFMMDERHSGEVSKALAVAAHLLTFADHLFNGLIHQQPGAITESREALIEIPPLVQQVRAAVQEERRNTEAGQL